MNSIVESLLGIDTLTDQVIAMDLLMSAKSGIKLYAMAATESATPEVRAVFEQHLHEAIATHEQVSGYMVEKGWYRPFDLQEQIQLDRRNVATALNIPS